MNAPILTDAAVTRLIRRILAAPATISDTLLVLADGLHEAASHTAESDAAAMLTTHAANLRHMAPYFTHRTAPAPPPCIDPARALIRKFWVSVEALRDISRHRPHGIDAGLLIEALINAAEIEWETTL